MNSVARTIWTDADHEARVERFYEAGIGADLEWHGGFRSFGWWESGTRDYLEAAHALVHEMNRRLGLTQDSRLLDVACGGAPQDILLHETTGATIDGIDATYAQVVQGQRRARERGLSDLVRIRHGSATRLDFAPETFTHVLCIEGAQHFDTREAFFRDAARFLVPGGVMAIADFVAMKPATRLWQKFVVRRAQRLWNVPDANVQDEAQYRASLERAGFTDISFEHVGRYTIPGYYVDQNTPETVDAHVKYKGRLWRMKMFWTNYFMNKAFEKGLMEYTLVRAVRR